MHSMSEYSHEFALYWPFTQQLCGKNLYVIDDQDLYHRMVRVVRLQPGALCVLFNNKVHARIAITEITKKTVSCTICTYQEHRYLQPAVRLILPLLKRQALEEALYTAVELGVTTVQLVHTTKVHRSWQEKDATRLEHVMIAAAEQSKNYAFPVIYSVKSLQECLNDLSLNSDKIVFDISGESFFEIHKQMICKHKYIIIGPEGGLTIQELSMIKEHGFIACSLTPTVLRALQAAAVGAALFRIS